MLDPDLASSVCLGVALSHHFPSFPSPPLYLQPPSLPIPPHPTRESGVCLNRPKHTGKALKKARLRCAFAVSSTFLFPHFFSASSHLLSYDLYHDPFFFLCQSLSGPPPSPSASTDICRRRGLHRPLFFLSTSDARSRPSIPPSACASSHQAEPLHWRPKHPSISDLSELDSVTPPPTFRSASVFRHSRTVDQLAPSVASQKATSHLGGGRLTTSPQS